MKLGIITFATLGFAGVACGTGSINPTTDFAGKYNWQVGQSGALACGSGATATLTPTSFEGNFALAVSGSSVTMTGDGCTLKFTISGDAANMANGQTCTSMNLGGMLSFNYGVLAIGQSDGSASGAVSWFFDANDTDPVLGACDWNSANPFVGTSALTAGKVGTEQDPL